MRRRLAAFLPLCLLTTACAAVAPLDAYDRPPLQIAAQIAKTGSPLRTVTRAETHECWHRSLVYVWGTDAEGRPLIAVVHGEKVTHYYLEGLSWSEALARVKEANYNPLPQEGTVTALDQQRSWVVSVQDPDLSTRDLLVSMRDGTITPVPGGGTYQATCDPRH